MKPWGLPVPNFLLFFFFFVKTVGPTMGQEVIGNRQPLGALVNGWARIRSCLHPLLSGTATSFVCPKSLVHSFSDGEQMPTLRLATQDQELKSVGEEA